MSDKIKYIVSYHVDTTWPESDHYYIAKQGSNGPIDLTEAEVRGVVRRLNGERTTGEATCTGRPTRSHWCCPPSFTEMLDGFLEKVAVECSIPVHMLRGEGPGGMK